MELSCLAIGIGSWGEIVGKVERMSRFVELVELFQWTEFQRFDDDCWVEYLGRLWAVSQAKFYGEVGFVDLMAF